MKIKLHFIVSILLLISSNTNSPAQTSADLEYQVKATFLFNFTQFIEWPATSFSSSTAPFIIGILGDDPFGNYLKETVSGEAVKGHPIIIQRYKEVSEIKACHILFININQGSKLEGIFSNLEVQNVLTVGNATSFIQKGGTINFYEEEGKIKFQVNPAVAEKAGLTISSKLLRLAKIVTL